MLRTALTRLADKSHPAETIGKRVNSAIVGWNDARDDAHSVDVFVKELDEIFLLGSGVVLDVMKCEHLLKFGDGVITRVEVGSKVILPDALVL